MPIIISQQRKVIETRFKNRHVQKNQLYELKNIRNFRRVLTTAGAFITVNMVPKLIQVTSKGQLTHSECGNHAGSTPHFGRM